MTNWHVEKTMGLNMRTIRTARGMTLKDLADKMTALGHEAITANTLGRWERGERAIPGASLLLLSQALACPYSALFVGADYRLQKKDDVEQMMIEFLALPQSERDTLLKITQNWGGNKLALIKYIQLCHIDLPPEYRREITAMGLVQREKAEKAGVVKHAEDVDSITEVWSRFYG